MANERRRRHELANEDRRPRSPACRARELLDPERDRRRRAGMKRGIDRSVGAQANLVGDAGAGGHESQAGRERVRGCKPSRERGGAAPGRFIDAGQSSFEVREGPSPSLAVMAGVQRDVQRLGRGREDFGLSPRDQDRRRRRGQDLPRCLGRDPDALQLLMQIHLDAVGFPPPVARVLLPPGSAARPGRAIR